MPSEWLLPERLDDPRYLRLYRALEELPGEDSVALAALVAEQDFYFFCRHITSFGKYTIRDEDHPRVNCLWVDEPDIFELCRQIQYVREKKFRDAGFFHARFTFKTTLIVANETLWDLVRNPQLTTALITHKVEATGDSIFAGFTTELESNPAYHQHWPHIFPQEKKDFPEFTGTSITVKRKPGPREPSISIHPSTRLPTGTHYDRIKEDDLVVRETVEKPEHIAKADGVREDATALGKADTPYWSVGTIWQDGDTNHKWIAEKKFNYLSVRGSFILPPGEVWTAGTRTDNLIPWMYSREFWEHWRKRLGPYKFSCLCMQSPIAKADQVFDPEWRRTYAHPPKREWSGTNEMRYLIIDPAGTERGIVDENDFWVWRVIDLRADRNVYSVDLWRERCNFKVALDMTFALMKYWKPKVAFCEEFGAQNVISPMRMAMEDRGFHFDLRKLPDLKLSKRQRIENLQVAYAAGRCFDPQDGFGHGSGPRFVDRFLIRSGQILDRPPSLEVRDERDTLRQFVEDEYKTWTPNRRGFDDMLDTIAWPLQEGMRGRVQWPSTPKTSDALTPDELRQIAFRELGKAASKPRTSRAGETFWTM